MVDSESIDLGEGAGQVVSTGPLDKPKSSKPVVSGGSSTAPLDEDDHSGNEFLKRWDEANSKIRDAKDCAAWTFKRKPIEEELDHGHRG